MSNFICTRCGNDKDEGCGMPDYKVPVHYEGGRVEMVRPACPLAFRTVFDKVSFSLKLPSLWAAIKGMFR